MGIKAPNGFRKDFRASYSKSGAESAHLVDNSMVGLAKDEVLPPRDSRRVWRNVDRPTFDYATGEPLPHGGNVSGQLAERAESDRRRWVASVAGSLAYGDPARFSGPDGVRAALEIAADLWRATNGGKNRLAGISRGRKPKPSAGSSQAIEARAYAKLLARMKRYAAKHGRPMPEPMVRRMVADSGLAA